MPSALNRLLWTALCCTLLAACDNGSDPAQTKSAPPAAAPAPAAASSDGEGIPTATVQKKKRWTGISMANLKEAPAGLPPEVKVQVTHVYRNSPGDRSGVKKGDMIIAANGTPITNFRDIGKVTKGQPPGFTFTMTVMREGKKLDFPVTLEERPGDMVAHHKEAWEGTTMVPFKLPALSGPGASGTFSSDALKGKVVILDFWATWCGPCRSAMPKLEQLETEYGPKGLAVVGISSEEEGVIKGFLGKRPLNYLILRDPTGDTKDDYEIDKLPTLFVIDRKGTVHEVAVGSGHVSSLEATIQRLL